MTKIKLLQNIDIEYKRSNADFSNLFSEYTILTLHKICCRNAASIQAGVYRKGPALPCGPGHNPPEASDIPHYMNHFINQMITSRPMFHPIEFAAISYKRLLDIYPFPSFNEETATLFMNLLLSREGYPLASIPSIYAGEYESAMMAARRMPNPDTDPLVCLIAKCIKRSF
ncbi:MAG: Fic family protein [Lachnospiraceae bacterium]|nr:Fic family protein [Lachnospiraceae bacterium]